MSFSTANASISASSVVPGLPNTTSTPSCFRISRNARFPEMTGKTSSDFLCSALRLFPQQILVLAGKHQFAVLVMDGCRHHHNAGRALRDQCGDAVRRIERIARIDALEELARLLDEADQLVADHVRERAGANRREGEHLKAVRQEPAQAVRLAERDV